MKKLMIAAAIVCAAAMSQASTVSWYYSGDVVTAEFPGTGSTEDYYCGTGTGYILSLGEAGGFTVNPDGTVELSGTAVKIHEGEADGGLVGFTDQILGSAYGKKEYMLLVVTPDTDGAWYGSTTAMAGTFNDNEDSHTAEVQFAIVDENFDAGFKPLVLSEHATAAAPEPTSGLLLLLGVAGLALKRKRA